MDTPKPRGPARRPILVFEGGPALVCLGMGLGRSGRTLSSAIWFGWLRPGQLLHPGADGCLCLSPGSPQKRTSAACVLYYRARRPSFLRTLSRAATFVVVATVQ